MQLDCNTEKGKVFISEQYNVQDRISKFGYVVVNTNGDSNNADAILCKNVSERLTVCGVAEIKSRKTARGIPLTQKYLEENGGYLITAEKITFGVDLAKKLSVPFFVIVSLMVENKLLIWKISDRFGSIYPGIEYQKTKTMATINGGVAERLNAFLPMFTKNLTIIE